MRHDERARIIEVLADRLVQLVKLPVISDPELEDHRAHAAVTRAFRERGTPGIER